MRSRTELAHLEGLDAVRDQFPVYNNRNSPRIIALAERPLPRRPNRPTTIEHQPRSRRSLSARFRIHITKAATSPPRCRACLYGMSVRASRRLERPLLIVPVQPLPQLDQCAIRCRSATYSKVEPAAFK